MTKSMDKKLVVGLEIGTAKVTSLVGEVLPDGIINIIGVGNCPSQGMDKGGVKDLESVIHCIKRAIDQAELMADCQISSVYLALSGKHICYQNEIGITPIAEGEVTQDDIDKVVYTAKSVRLQNEYRILHIIPQDYTIDHQDKIKNPIGLSGIRMQAKVHLITCHNDISKNIIKAVERCGLVVDQLVFSGLAASYSVLTHDERELGVCIVDIGAGTMDIAIYTSGALQHTKVIPYAGNIVTNDIAYAFGTSVSDAEMIKINYGCALSSLISKDENIEIPTNISGQSSRTIQRQTLAEVIEIRYKELFSLINNEIIQLREQLQVHGSRYQIPVGIVLTGGGTKIDGLLSCAQLIFNTQVRIGKPLNITGLTDYVQEPCYSTVIGLLHYGKESFLTKKTNKKKYNLVSTWFVQLSNWLKKEF